MAAPKADLRAMIVAFTSGAVSGYAEGHGTPIEPQAIDTLLVLTPSLAGGIVGGVSAAADALDTYRPTDLEYMTRTAKGSLFGALPFTIATSTGYGLAYTAALFI